MQDFWADIETRLSSLGYTMASGDKTVISYIENKTTETFKNHTNLDEVPEGLYYKWIDAICADFLSAKYSTGGLSENETKGIISKIQEGDTTVEYATGSTSNTPQAVFLKTIESLKLPYSEIIKYRRLVW